MEKNMRKLLITMSAIALGIVPVAGMAQTMTAEQVGAAPMTGTPSENYAAWAADSDKYEIQSSRIALSKSKSDATKAFAREMIADHTTTTKALMSALPKTEPKVKRPPSALSEPNAAKIAALKSADADSIDALYMQQQAEAHRAAWSLHKGYSTDGQDPALKQVADSAVPIIEKHLAHLQSAPSGM
jgi:putative membrane protein